MIGTFVTFSFWAQVANWLALLTSGHKVQVRIPLEVELKSCLYSALFHRAFHYQPNIFSVWHK